MWIRSTPKTNTIFEGPGLNVLGEICARQTCLGGLAAAHGQITERKYSVAQFRFFYSCGSESCLRSHENSLIMPRPCFPAPAIGLLSRMACREKQPP
jgi:hypothetical protein